MWKKASKLKIEENGIFNEFSYIKALSYNVKIDYFPASYGVGRDNFEFKIGKWVFCNIPFEKSLQNNDFDGSYFVL